MGSSSRFKFAPVFLLLLIAVVGSTLLSSPSLSMHAAQPSSKFSIKSKVTASFNCGGWNVVSSPNLLTGNTMFYGVSAANASNVWAVGYYTSTFNNQTLIEHWNGSSWRVISSPNPGPGGNILNAVVAVSVNSVWAVGASWEDRSFNHEQALIEHWNGKIWKVVASPTASAQLTAITRVPGTNQLWAVGLDGLTEHWDGTSWSVVTTPTTGTFKGVAATNANDVWAVGVTSSSPTQALVEHWNGTIWSVVSGPNLKADFSMLNGVLRVPGTNKIWTVGDVTAPSGPTQTLTEQWDGKRWRVIPRPNLEPNNSSLGGVTGISSDNMWAVGGFINGSASNSVQALTEHWDGKKWNIVSSPNTGSFLVAITTVPGATNQFWAVGVAIDSNGLYQTLTEVYC